MIDLTARQIQILKTTVEEYIESGEPVGSETIDKKYNLGVSPATIRNEMVYLTNQGYLKQEHISSGRVPTSLALRLYIKEFMKKKNLSVADEVSVKERIWESHKELDELLEKATKVLADRSKALSVAVTQDHKAFHSGYAHLLDEPEFYDIDVTRSVLSLIEEITQLENIFFRKDGDEDTVRMLFGDDLGNKSLDDVTLVFTGFTYKNKQCSLGVIGSKRLDYSYVIPMVEYFHDLITEFFPEK